MQTIILKPSAKPDEKFVALVDNRKIYFGAAGYSDYTQSQDDAQKARYISRHQKNENWTASGMTTPGFYAKHVLWNKPTLQERVRDLNRRFKQAAFKLVK